MENWAQMREERYQLDSCSFLASALRLDGSLISQPLTSNLLAASDDSISHRSWLAKIPNQYLTAQLQRSPMHLNLSAFACERAIVSLRHRK